MRGLPTNGCCWLRRKSDWGQSGRGARLHKCVVDSGILLPPGLVIGEDPVLDAQRFRRTDSGICLVTQPMIDRLAA